MLLPLPRKGGSPTMPPKRKKQEEEGPLRKKAPIFTEAEPSRLIALYCEGRDRYHGRFRSGSRSGPSERQSLLKEWASDIPLMGLAHRTPEAIEEKIKNEVRRVQKFIRAEVRF
ncbi:hypothetical protein Y032_0080g1388 [Ancylostoma ceylanicum]|uniref:Uncharacterized protein n=1 Tax=Ancylostoma ceylanicum TaxID=53326 RepID=A0A016TT49_9BILA|nr:hypothetical protein Y032_0080g1388 [Ancylostoma ceylanicum]